MKQVLVIHLNDDNDARTVSLLGQEVKIERVGCGGDAERARALIAECDGHVDAIGLEGLPAQLQLETIRRPHEIGALLPAAARVTPVVDGSGIRPALERWGVILADRAQPGIFSQKRILLTPGLNHVGLAQAFLKHSPYV